MTDEIRTGDARSVSSDDGQPEVSIVAIGDELLSGIRTDANGPWLARRFSELGFRVGSIVAVGDDPRRIGETLRRALDASDLVVSTGGLGPTGDDRTREAVARTWGLELGEDSETLAEIRSRFRSRGYHDVPEPSRRMARVPEGAVILPNPAGLAPGLRLDLPSESGGRGGGVLILLPGIPGEVQALVEGPVRDTLRDAFGEDLTPASVRTIHTTGIPESALAGRLEALLADVEGLEVAYRPSTHGVTLQLLGRGTGADDRLDRAEELIEPVLAPYRYDAPGGNLASAVGRALSSSGLRIAVAESCTGGLVLKRLTDIPGSSEWVVGGVVAYADRIKEGWLEVPASVLSASGAVSEPVARAMAEGIRRRFGVEVGVGVTGIAGPGGGVEGKPVGTVWFGITGARGTHAEKVWFPGGRTEVRARAAQHVLHLVLRSVQAPGREERIRTSDADSEHAP